MSRLVLSLLGPFRASRDGRPVTAFHADTSRALLAYLAMNPGIPHRREALAGLLWPDHPEREARHNLSQALNRVHQALNERPAIGERPAIDGRPAARGHSATEGEEARALLKVTREAIEGNFEGAYWLDVGDFRAGWPPAAATHTGTRI